MSPRWPVWASFLLFFGSGFSALIYEVIWFQLLEQVVGSSAISLGIILGTFMGGMGLGSLLFPRFVPPKWHPFRVYALLELGIAVFGVLVLLEIPFVRHLYTGGSTQGPAGIILRAAFAGLCLLPPAAFMGATLPAIARWVDASPGGAEWLGRLYASNIAGGIGGCLLAGFYLLREHDIETATALAVLVNLVVAGVSLLIARRTSRAQEPRREREETERGSGLVYATIALSGFSALAGEVVWTRILALLLGPTVYTFSIILAVFLLGLGIGSAVGSFVARSSTNPRRDLGVAQVLLGGAIAWTAFALARSLPYWPIAPTLAQSPWISFQLDLVRCLWAILPPTVLWGASFPLALSAVARPGRDPGRWVGGVYAANTIGAIAGALCFTFVVVPAWGTHAAQQLMIALAALPGLTLLAPWSFAKEGSRPARGTILAVAGVLSLVLLATVPPIPKDLITLGRYAVYSLSRPEGANPRQDPRILYVGEGLSESVAVSENGPIRLFHVSGKVEASTGRDDMRLQRMLGNIPALVHPGRPRTALVVGCGAGVTAGSLLLHPSIERIVICEIEPLVPRKIAPFFAAQNHGVVSDPRVTIVYDDARHYILTTKEKFDIITSDPIHPWVKGAASLYSKEYFELVREHLNPGGIVSQWVPVYETSEKTVRGELATFFSVFPTASLWANRNAAGGYDLVMTGRAETSARVDLDGLAQRWRRADHMALAQSLEEVGFGSPVDLLATYVGRRADLGTWIAGAEVNRDRRPWLQYQAGLDTYTRRSEDVLRSLAAYRRFPEEYFVGSDSLKTRLKSAGGRPRGSPSS